MLIKERQNAIFNMIRERKYCTVDYLAKQLFVAPITIRRDLAKMEAEGLIARCYGGATIPDYENREVPFELRSRSHFSMKEELMKRAVKLVNVGDVVFLDSSSTISCITEYLTADMELTVITNSTLVAEKLKEKHVRCYLSGGMTVENSYALVGSIADHTVAGFYANICFFSAQGIDEKGMISDQSEAETTLRRLMIKNSKKQYFVFDDSKYGKRFAFQLCSTEEITGVITNLEENSVQNIQ